MRSEATRLAYFAGVIDSDGYFTITRRAGKERADGTRATYYTARVGCNQIHRLIPDLLAATFGGRVYEYEAKANKQPLFMWQCYSQAAYRAAERLLPWLQLKRQQAEVVIAFGAALRRTRGPLRIEPEHEEERAALSARLRALNAPRRMPDELAQVAA